MRPVENKDGTGWHLESVREEAEQMIPASKVRGLRDRYESRRRICAESADDRNEAANSLVVFAFDALLREYEGGAR